MQFLCPWSMSSTHISVTNMEVTASKRKICIPLEVLLDNLDSAEFTVDQFIETDISSFADNETSLPEFLKKFKIQLKKYEAVSHEAGDRLCKNGQVAEIKEIRQNRLRLQKEADTLKQRLNSLCTALGIDSLSSFDKRSTRNGFSLTSQLSQSKPGSVHDTVIINNEAVNVQPSVSLSSEVFGKIAQLSQPFLHKM